jgi:hypothetical protein
MPLPRSLTAVPRDGHVRQEIAKAIQSLFAQIREQDAQHPLQPSAEIRERELIEQIVRHIPSEFAPVLHVELRKSGYDPNEPRVPAGNPHGGEWTGDGGSANPRVSPVVSDAPEPNGWDPGALYAANQPPGIGHNQGPPLDEPPKIPPEPPGTVRAINAFAKAAAAFLARAAKDPRVAAFVAALAATVWLSGKYIASIKAYLDPPKTWEELQQDALNPQPGYDIHHPVEQTPARQAGFPESQIDGPENRLRIPTMKHWQITGWYATPNEEYGGLSPRDYLKDKSWEERLRVGKEALIIFGVLKP